MGKLNTEKVVHTKNQKKKREVPNIAISRPLLNVPSLMTDEIQTSIIKYTDDTVICCADKDLSSLINPRE